MLAPIAAISMSTKTGVDDRCEILKVEKQAENLYTVQRCSYDRNDDSIPIAD